LKVFFTHLGCKLNQAEIDGLARRFLARGHEVVGSLDDADLHVVNSCTVTAEAARDSRKAARRARRGSSATRTVLTGCWATMDPLGARSLAGVDLVVDNADKDRLVDQVEAVFGDAGTPPVDGAPEAVPVSYVPLRFGPARALVKIEDGCDMRCAFCVIPHTRGAQRSRPLDDVVREVRALEAAGHAEIVVTGVQISAYRDGATRLPALLDALLDATTTCRFRLTSIAPWDLDRATVERLAHARVCRHVHLSLQSGDDRTLRRMRRPYTAAEFAARVAEVRTRVAGVAVTTDVIAGFPGETDDDFESSLAFVEAMGFARVHAFRYSRRPGTAAADLPDQVSSERKRDRMARLLATAAAAETAFRRSQVGSIARVLWEGRRDGRWLGTSDNYVRVFAESDAELRGRLTAARLLGVAGDGVIVSL
jgi:threonylcarbamoyladenosine tRNA methylthiotransferase MtaB